VGQAAVADRELGSRFLRTKTRWMRRRLAIPEQALVQVEGFRAPQRPSLGADSGRMLRGLDAGHRREMSSLTFSTLTLLSNVLLSTHYVSGPNRG
jgi:hypothetical protein